MTIKKPISAKTLLIGSAEIYVAKRWSDPLKQMGVYKEHELTTGAETVDDVYSNYKTKKVKNGDLLNVAFSYHEQRPEILEIIENGVMELESSAGGSAVVTSVYKPGDWGFDVDNLLEKQDVNSVAPTAVTLTITKGGVTTPLVAGTDFNIVPQAIGNGYFAFQFIVGGVLVAGDEDLGIINYTYTVTEGAEQKFVHKASAVPTGFVCMIIWKGSYDGQEMRREVALENVQNTKAFTNFRGDSDDDTASYACAFQGTIISDKSVGFE